MPCSNLVIIFCGKDSLHQEWKQNTNDYNFDLALLKYDDCRYKDSNSKSAKFIFEKPQLKFHLFTDFLKSPGSGEFHGYERYLMLDDDIRTTPHHIGKFFEVFERYNFDLAQPALDKDSFITHEPTRKIDKAIYHTTSTVEIMNPGFSRRALQYIMEDFFSCPTGHGFGLENAWTKKLHAGNGASIFGGLIGVIDCVEFCHTRPVGSGDIYDVKFGEAYAGSSFFENKYNTPVCWNTIDVVY